MVAYLNKSDASEGFNQVIDFLNGIYIKYALTVNPNIYVSWVKQFWNIVVIKQDNDVTRLQALVDKKKVVIIEATIREVLRLDDAKRVDCLPNEEIFAELACMGYEKPSTKLTFYKAFFSSQWKFLIHTILQSMSAKHTSWNEFSSLINRVGKGFSRVETPLFEGMLVEQVIEEGGDEEEHVEANTAAQGDDTTAHEDDAQEPSIPSSTPPTPPPQPPQDLPSTSQGRKIDELDEDDDVVLMDDKEEDKKEEEAKVVEDDQVRGRQAESQAEIYKIDMDHPSKVLSMQEDEPAEVHEVVDVVTTAKLIIKVVTAVSEIVTATSTIISAAKSQVPAATIIVAPVRVVAAPTRRRKGVVIRDPEEESTTSSIIPADTKSKDKGIGIMVEEPKPLKKKQQVEMDEEYARKLHAELNEDIEWDVAIDHVKQKPKEDPANVAGFRLDYFKGMSYDDIPKRRKLNEEVEDLKRHLEIVPDEDDDVYTEATPLARKVPVVDYKIIHLNNKPYYKIIRADGTHHLYISFLTLLKNFDREDLEALWSLVKERNRMDKQVWKNQRTIHGQAKVKSWKLLESCGVQIITFSTTQLILLVERRYPLLRFTLYQMLNAVRLRVEEESEMSLELLRFTRQHHQEGQLE
nr:hypothetical protein [Tanacetum cinerariifolium]